MTYQEELIELYETLSKDQSLQYLEIDPDQLTFEEMSYDRTGRLRAWRRLSNVIESLDDMASAQEGPALVGFLGHF